MLEFADEMNRLIVEAIRETGVAKDRVFNAADIRDVNAYLRRELPRASG